MIGFIRVIGMKFGRKGWFDMRNIDADALSKKLHEDYHGAISDSSLYVYQILRILNEAPTVDAAAKARGKWVRVTNGRGGNECSKCHSYAPSRKNGVEHLSAYCPTCGAEMKGDGDSQ